MQLTEADIKKIAAVLKVSPTIQDDEIQFTIQNPANGFTLSLTIYQNVSWNDQKVTIVSALTPSGMYQLHNCIGYVTFEDEEVIFVSQDPHHSSYFSTMTIGNNASCSIFASVNQELLHTDFGALDERLLLAAMQLAIIESLFSAGED